MRKHIVCLIIAALILGPATTHANTLITPIDAVTSRLNVYDYECPAVISCCHVSASITDAPAQYLGYVRY